MYNMLVSKTLKKLIYNLEMEIATYMNHTLHKGEQLPNRSFWYIELLLACQEYLST